MKRANRPTTLTCRIVAKRMPAGTSKTTGKPYDSFVAFKIHEGDKVTDFRFVKGTNIDDIIEAVDAGASTFDVTFTEVLRFEKDSSHRYPLVIGKGYDKDATICYDLPEDLPL